MSRKILLEVKNLKQYFPLGRKSVVKEVDDVSFHIYEGETFGLVCLLYTSINIFYHRFYFR